MKTPEPVDLLHFREIYYLTQVQAAQLVGVCERTWQFWEAGAYRMRPGLWLLARARAQEMRRRADLEAGANKPG